MAARSLFDFFRIRRGSTVKDEEEVPVQRARQEGLRFFTFEEERICRSKIDPRFLLYFH
jgi:hypothetical protein